ETGTEPNRGELFVASRTRSDESFVCDEARLYGDNLKQVMTENIQSKAHDAFEQVFGPEKPGRVQCEGRDPTPSKYFSNKECTSSTAEMIHIKKQEHFQAIAKDKNTKLKTNLYQSSSINSDQF
ncbi:unnamed protein product, partial [Thlaspi arvense]